MENETIEVYQAHDGWRWRLKARNGLNIGNGSEAYSSKAEVLLAVIRVKTAMVRADVIDTVSGT